MTNEELKALALAATPGPWEHRFVEGDGTSGAICHEHGWVADEFTDQSFKDTAYMAAANPTAVLGLIADLEGYQQGAKAEADTADEARAEIRRLKAECEGLRQLNADGLAVLKTQGDQLLCYIKDAERYRWLRSDSHAPTCQVDDRWRNCEHLDAAVDAALSKEASNG